MVGWNDGMVWWHGDMVVWYVGILWYDGMVWGYGTLYWYVLLVHTGTLRWACNHLRQCSMDRDF